MSYNRPYSTLHSPDDIQPNHLLHTPIEPSRNPNNPYHMSAQYTGEPVPESPGYMQHQHSFPAPPTSQYPYEQHRHSFSAPLTPQYPYEQHQQMPPVQNMPSHGFPPQQSSGGFPAPPQTPSFPPQQSFGGFPAPPQSPSFPPQQSSGGFPAPPQSPSFPPPPQSSGGYPAPPQSPSFPPPPQSSGGYPAPPPTPSFPPPQSSGGFPAPPPTPSFPPPPQSAMSSHHTSADASAHDTPGLLPLSGVETFMMTSQPTTQSPPPPFEQPRSPPPAFDPRDPHPMSTPDNPGALRPPMPLDTSYGNSDAGTAPHTPKTPMYTPGAAAGPNGGVHAPGQIGHPNQQHGPNTYHHGMCDCFSDIPTCCLGYWCPCILYSRTYHRLKTVPNSNLNDFQSCNTHCGMFCLLAPVSFVLNFFQRTRIRENYNLQGSIGDDCVKTYCCTFCVLVQDDREVAHREDERRRFAGPSSGVVGDGGYRRQPTMQYP